MRIEGNGGRDVIRTDWYDLQESKVRFDQTNATTGNEKIFGDWEYDNEDRLDKDIWGDADEIWGGDSNNGASGATGSFSQRIYGGDGDDKIHGGDSWAAGSFLYGNTGDDTIWVG